VIAALTGAIAVGRPAAALVGATEPGDFNLGRQLVMILKSGAGNAGFCTGIVVGRRIVLTAAHCVGAAPATKAYFQDRNGQPVFASVVEVATHPGYRAEAPARRQRSIDLALVHLDRDLVERVPLTLATVATVLPGAAVQIAGFGVASEADPRSAGTLRSATLTVRAPQSSILLWLEDPTHRGTGACAGDSGGPILRDQAVVAVTAWAEGLGRRHCGALTQAALIAPQRAWIEAILNAWSQH
jgi:hypothetical protein